MTRAQETAAIKRALARAGIAARVWHGWRGTGTASRWIEVDVGESHVPPAVTREEWLHSTVGCPECVRIAALRGEALRVAAEASGRCLERDYNDSIQITTQDARVVQRGRWAPAPAPAAEAAS